MVKVAFFTNDLKNIDAHFGSGEQFAVYDVNGAGYNLLDVVQTGEERTEGRVEMLQHEHIDIVYCVEIGPAAAAKVVNSKIFPIKYKEVVSIEAELDKLQSMIATNPPPFIKKIIEARG
ncbi:MAG: NifB/NifX family molybdenum-iron cluster-binding protein [Sulfurospirillum sp.]|uniref:NifB/NifX family molybdenum-iron cluster-binding protein n=1 Tax=Sulfurospirillum sp. UCH001 TaxID=1581011 RepID=UPI000830E992|nr:MULTISPECIES: NifB/NifX family molybdenum-iron cluster-binding protein [unclassified Sulfurospirillum]WNY98667.1 dinitrogenase iron-molybdenum cofactor biosynthesis protein [Sulfurospirillum sp. 'SP']